MSTDQGSESLVQDANNARSDEELIDVVRDTVQQLESLTGRLQSYLDYFEG